MPDMPEYPVASTIGAGLCLNAEGEVGILVMLGVTDEDEIEHTTLAGIILTPELAELITKKLQALLEDAEMAENAVATMGQEAASEYLNNWSKRGSAKLN